MPPGHNASKRLLPSADQVIVRMYRIGHGDCFLIAFPGKLPDEPVYVLIDCGYKPGSPEKIDPLIDDRVQKIVESIHEATGGGVDVAVISHEHQDHVNAITASRFKSFEIKEHWLAWTEDPEDELAQSLQKDFEHKLHLLLDAHHRLQAAGDIEQASRIRDFLEFEFGGDSNVFNLAAAAAGPRGNKGSMKVFRDRSGNNIRYIHPHDKPLTISGAKELRVYAMGPPRDRDLLETMDPEGDEEFHGLALGAKSPTSYFAAALNNPDRISRNRAPFLSRYCFNPDAPDADPGTVEFFDHYYGGDESQTWPPARDDQGYDEIKSDERKADEIASNAGWRRIDAEWLYSADQLAMDISDFRNNTSLVLAFELGRDGKVLLFPADAQRGNWLSWANKDWKVGRKKVTARDLLSRTVLYKVGHHGSHNATLNGQADDDYPNLAWIAHETYADEFTAMIPAVRKWAETQKGWDHPLKAIKDALLEKASGRVFQTDTGEAQLRKQLKGSASLRNDFLERTIVTDLYFDYTVSTSED